MKTIQSAALAALLLPAVAAAQNSVSHNCVLGDMTRRVEIFYEPGRAVPCEVHYYKDTEAPGERQVLWSATNQEGYCEQKTDEFVAQLENWGWDCGDVSAAAVGPDPTAAPAPEPAPAADDTEALAPAEDAAEAAAEGAD